MDFEENSPHQEGIITEMYISPDQSYIEQPQEMNKFSKCFKISAEIPSKTGRYRQNSSYNQEKGTKRHTLAPYHQGDTGRLLNQPVFQGFVQIFGSEHIAS